jgi:hypothetical protein
MVLKDVMVDPDEPEKKSKINRKGTKVGKKWNEHEMKNDNN